MFNGPTENASKNNKLLIGICVDAVRRVSIAKMTANITDNQNKQLSLAF